MRVTLPAGALAGDTMCAPVVSSFAQLEHLRLNVCLGPAWLTRDTSPGTGQLPKKLKTESWDLLLHSKTTHGKKPPQEYLFKMC
jgi:hypothetical protein